MQKKIIAALAGVIAVAGLGYGAYRMISLSDALTASTVRETSLADTLAQAKAHNEELSRKLADEIDRTNGFAAQIRTLGGTVDTLTKLSETDKELLAKYSRVYFLNENYVPRELADVDTEYVLEPSRHLAVHAKVEPFLEHMLLDADDAGARILVASAYRSFKEQAGLKNSYLLTYGSGSNRFSADQGYSEHQLGTALDFVSPKQGALSLTFASTTAGTWLSDNAWRYGFILSYPKGNGYYQYEPWHWRFVGTALARTLHDEDKRFYDLPQREIDTYLVQLFD